MSLSTVVSGIKLFVSILPVLSSFIDSAEELFPEGGNGQAKLQVVKTAINHFVVLAGNTQAVFETVWPLIQAIIATVVAAKK